MSCQQHGCDLTSTLLMKAFQLTKHLTMPKSIYSEQAGRAGKQLAHTAQRVAIIWLDSTYIMETMDIGCLFGYWNVDFFFNQH